MSGDRLQGFVAVNRAVWLEKELEAESRTLWHGLFGALIRALLLALSGGYLAAGSGLIGVGCGFFPVPYVASLPLLTRFGGIAPRKGFG